MYFSLLLNHFNMRKIFMTMMLAGAVLCASAQSDCDDSCASPQECSYQVVPLPSSILPTKAEPVKLCMKTVISVADASEDMQRNARFLAEYIREATGMDIPIGVRQKGQKAIVLRLNAKIQQPEGYRITIGNREVLIEGRTAQGVFYGIQTLRKSLPMTKGAVVLPAAIIEDSPRFAYRGMHLDVSRHYFSLDFVKQYIDMMVLHNMNVFHWHLTDDQGWRMEIKKYPKLTTEGSVRANTVLGRNSTVTDGTPHGGFYTQAECREIVEYARQRYITVIPEIDMPGHMLGALTAYPELGCTGGPYHVEGRWGVFDDILCAGKEKTFQFVEDVLTEVMDVFPAEYIHIGGDEAPRTRWKACPLCQQRIADEGLVEKDGQSPEARLQGYFTKRVERFINDHGRKLIGWDELLESDVNPSATIMSWRGTKGGLEASKKGHDVIMTPVGYCYFDYYQTDNTTWGEPLSIGGNLPVEKTYSFNPAPPTLSPEAQSHIIGVQGNLWTEYIAYPTQAEYHVLPRMGALAEVQWMEPAQKDFSSFLERSQSLLRWYKHYGWTYAPHIYR